MKKIMLLCLISQGFLFSKRIEIPRNIREVFYPEFLKNKETRRDDSPLLSPESFRACADFILDETIWEIETDDLFEGAVIYVGLRSLHDFFYQVLPYVNNKIILVSQGGEPFKNKKNWDSYYSSPDYLTPKIADHSNILAFYSINMIYNHPKCFCIPIGKNYWAPSNSRIIKKNVKHLSIDSYFRPKKIKFYLNGSSGTHKSRRLIFDYWSLLSEVTYIDRLPFRKYFARLAKSQFVISPRGFGIDCLRTWEALYAGAIPVVESWGIDSVYEGLPVIIVKDLTKTTIEDLEEEYEKLKQKEFNLDALFIDFWMKRIRNAK